MAPSMRDVFPRFSGVCRSARPARAIAVRMPKPMVMSDNAISWDRSDPPHSSEKWRKVAVRLSR